MFLGAASSATDEKIMPKGLVIKESLTDTSVINHLTVTKTEAEYVENAASDQPDTWTLISYTCEDREAEGLAKLFAASLKEGKWYTNFTTGDNIVYVIFPKKIFTYPVGDLEKKQTARDYARSVGIPDGQVDWDE